MSNGDFTVYIDKKIFIAKRRNEIMNEQHKKEELRDKISDIVKNDERFLQFLNENNILEQYENLVQAQKKK